MYKSTTSGKKISGVTIVMILLLKRTRTKEFVWVIFPTNNYHRQVLLAFMDEKATSDIDNGYDGYSFDDFLMTCIFE
jgi:hypothetical protein